MAKQRSLAQKKAAQGYWYVLPFALGFVFLFLYPMCQSLLYSFGTLDQNNNFKLVLEGIENYRVALREDAVFYRYLIESIKDMFFQLPIILIFSFIMANLLKQSFFGRDIIRMIFFLPVVLAPNIVTRIEEGNLVQGIYSSMVTEGSSLVSTESLQQFLLDMNLPTGLAEYIMTAVSEILFTVNHSGIQILIFLAALQSISPSLYEASSIEGASAWENFWKITFPLVMPQMVVCVVYTVVDRFVDMNNPVMVYVQEQAYGSLRFGLSAAMSWIYTVVVVIILAVFVIAFNILSRRYEC